MSHLHAISPEFFQFVATYAQEEGDIEAYLRKLVERDAKERQTARQSLLEHLASALTVDENACIVTTAEDVIARNKR